MVKKMKSPIEGLDPQQLQAGLRESAQQIWMAGLGAFAKAQAGGNKVFEALMKDGGALHSTRQAAREQVDDMSAKASGTWDKLEQVFEKRVAKALHTLGVPTHDDVQTLSRRVAELTAMVDALSRPTAAGSARARKAGAKAVKAAASRSAAPQSAPAKATASKTAARKASAGKATTSKATASKKSARPSTARKAGA